MKKTFYAIMILAFVVMTQTACWQSAEEGTVQVQTIDGKGITKVIKGGNYVSTWDTFYDSYYEVSMRPELIEVPLDLVAKDSAGFKQTVVVPVRPINDENSIMEFVRKFGLDPEARRKLMTATVSSETGTQSKGAFSQYDSYALIANQEAIQTDLTNRLTPFLKANYLELDGKVQLKGKPNFDDDRIDNAASAVVANQKLKEASQAALDAARVDAEKKQVESQTYANPVMFKLKELELRVEIAKALATHNGTLVLGNGSGLTMTEQASK